jgi:hypothetical protein
MPIATTPTKKISRLALPRSGKTGAAHMMTPATTATNTSAMTTSRTRLTCARRIKPTSSIKAAPTGSANARQASLICSAGVRITVSAAAKSYAGHSTSASSAIERTIASVSTSARRCGDRRLTKAVIRICSPRRNASTAPSIDSQRNRMPASSSDQTSG